MKLKVGSILFLIIACWLLGSNALAQSAHYWQWAHGLPDTHETSIAAHPTDGSYFSCIGPDTLSFNGNQLVHPGIGPDPGFLMRFNGYGSLLWTKFASGPVTINSTDTNGTVQWWAHYQSSFELGDSLALSTRDGIVTGELDENGLILKWTNYADLFELYGSNERVDVAVDQSGELFVAIHYVDSLLFDGMMHRTTSTWKRMLFLSRISEDGTIQWARNVSPVQELLQVEAKNDMFYLSTLFPDSNSVADSLLGDGSIENSLVVLDTLGQALWRATTYNCIGCFNEQRFAVFEDGDVIRAHTNLNLSGQATQKLTRFNDSGGQLWQQYSNATNGSIRTDGLIALSNGGFINSGRYFNDFAWNVGSTIALPQSLPSVFVSAFDSNGSIQWAHSAGSSIMGGFCSNDANGALYCTGYSDSGGNFDGQSVSSNSQYVAKLTDSPLSIQENPSEDISIYPNPVVKNALVTLQIDIEEALGKESLQLTIINSLGQRVEEFQIENPRHEIQAPKEAGIYFLHLSSENKWISETKLVVK